MWCDPKACREAERQLRRYRELKEAVARERRDVLLAEDYTAKNGRGGATGSVTEAKAVRLCRPSKNAKWLEVVERTRARFAGTEKEAVIRLCFDERISPEGAAMRMNVSRETLFRMKREVVHYAVHLADKRRLVKV